MSEKKDLVRVIDAPRHPHLTVPSDLILGPSWHAQVLNELRRLPSSPPPQKNLTVLAEILPAEPFATEIRTHLSQMNEVGLRSAGALEGLVSEVENLLDQSIRLNELFEGLSDQLERQNKLTGELVRQAHVQNELSRRSLQLKLAEKAYHSNPGVRLQVAQDSLTPSRMLLELTSDSNSSVDVRVAVVENPNAPQQALSELAEDDTEYIRVVVAIRTNLPGVLNKLADDDSVNVCMAVAKNRHSPPEALEKLVSRTGDSNVDVRMAVVVHDNTLSGVLEKLLYDDDEHLSVRLKVIEYHNLSPEMLNKLADDDSPDVLMAVAINHNTPPEALKKLAKRTGDSNAAIRRKVALHYNTPPETREQLASDSNADVRMAARAYR